MMPVLCHRFFSEFLVSFPGAFSAISRSLSKHRFLFSGHRLNEDNAFFPPPTAQPFVDDNNDIG
jgi:hypothetical protein